MNDEKRWRQSIHRSCCKAFRLVLQILIPLLLLLNFEARPCPQSCFPPFAPEPITTKSYPDLLPEVPLTGLYTDKVSYEPGESIKVFGNWPNKTIQYVVRRAGFVAPGQLTTPPHDWPDGFSEVTLSFPDKQVVAMGSFIEVPYDLASAPEFTIEGWFWPTYTNPDQAGVDPSYKDFVVLAGQVDESESDSSCAWIGIDREGRLCAGIVTGAPGSTTKSTVVDTSRLELYTWHYVAVTFDAAAKRLRLFRGSPQSSDPCLELLGAATTSASTIHPSGYPLRIGARMEAPGDMTGCADGRFDRWAIWSRKLTRGELQARLNDTWQWPTLPDCITQSLPGTADLQVEYTFEDYPTATPGQFSLYPGQNMARDTSDNGRDGTIVNHGAPGVAGPGMNCPGRAIRLNHDRVLEAGFDRMDVGESGPPVIAEIPIPDDPPWPSGLYVVQAVETAYAHDVYPNTLATRFASFVVRPEPVEDPAPDIAVIVPTFTWQAYNTWPGGLSEFTKGLTTAKGMTQRIAVGTDPFEYFPQGLNGLYDVMGDGLSGARFCGWLRPNILASPVFLPSPNPAALRPLNGQGAFLAWKFVEWIENPIGENTLPWPYDLYADEDLDNGALRLVDGGLKYNVVMMFGKPEYCSYAFLSELDTFVKAGGSIVSLCGNSFAWRAESFRDSRGTLTPNRVLECLKWPSAALVGLQDATSLKDGGRAGSWRYILQEGLTRYPMFPCSIEPMPECQTYWYKDYILGTMPDTGNLNGPSGCKDGYWRVRDSTHWLWGDDNVGPISSQRRTLTSLGRIVGVESDAFQCSMEEHPRAGTCDSPDETPSVCQDTFADTLPQWGGFPYSTDGKVAILADTDFFTGQVLGCGVTKYNRWHESFQLDYPTLECGNLNYLDGPNLDALQINMIPICLEVGDLDHGNGFAHIVYYDTKWSGGVLQIGSIDCVFGLRPVAACPGSDCDEAILSNLVQRALTEMVQGPAHVFPHTPPQDCYGVWR